MAHFNFVYFALQMKNQLKYPKAYSEGGAAYSPQCNSQNKRAIISKVGGYHNECLTHGIGGFINTAFRLLNGGEREGSNCCRDLPIYQVTNFCSDYSI